MKKVIVIIASVLMFCLLAFGAVGCTKVEDMFKQLTCEHEYDDGVIVKEATCFEKGELDKTCSLCGKVETEDIDMVAHTSIFVEAKVPTCLEVGFTDGTACAVCDVLLTGCQEVPALGHHVDIVKGYDATCVLDGLTDGSRCNRCDEFIVEQTKIPAKGHSLVNVSEKEPTCSSIGWSSHVVCEGCDSKYGYEEYSKLPHTYVKENNCSVCGVVPLSEYVEDENLFVSTEMVADGEYALAGSIMSIAIDKESKIVDSFCFIDASGADYTLRVSLDESLSVVKECSFLLTMETQDGVQMSTLDILSEDSGFTVLLEGDMVYITFPETFEVFSNLAAIKYEITSSTMFSAYLQIPISTPESILYTPISK